jgi:hypothetical protein
MKSTIATKFDNMTYHTASHQISVHFGKAVSDKKIFLEIDQSKTGITCGSHVCKWTKTK